MSELEENLSALVLWIRCTFVVLCIYAGALLIAGCQVLGQWLSLKSPAAGKQGVASSQSKFTGGA